MTFRGAIFRRSFVGLACLAAGFAAIASDTRPVFAQQKGVGLERLLPVKDFSKDKEELRQLKAMQRGEMPVSKDVCEHAAQWYLYRLTWPEFQEGSVKSPGGAMISNIGDLVKQATDSIPTPEPGKALPSAQQTYVAEYGKHLVKFGREVLKNPRPIARLNTLLVLSRLAEAGNEEVADVCIEVLKNEKESPAVKFWAVRTLGNLFEKTRGSNPNKIAKEREERAIGAELEYLDGKWDYPKDATQEEKDAVHYIRREVLRAVAQTRYPALEKTKDGKKTLGAMTAAELLKYLQKDQVKPEPTIAEQVEAAIGLLQLQPKLVLDFQADFALAQVGRFLVEFANRYQVEKEQRKEPWQRNAARLLTALNELKVEVDSALIPQHVKDYINKFSQQATPLLQDVLNDKATQAATLNTWLDANQPKGTALFKSLAAANK